MALWAAATFSFANDLMEMRVWTLRVGLYRLASLGEVQPLRCTCKEIPMDFDDTPEEAEFRAEVRAWLAQNAAQLFSSAARTSNASVFSPGFLASDAAKFMTGSDVTVDGGYSMV
jgi:NAD(P)-dependent dehydrogenase (short-subunit alcohol dehydrogenase family)